jgi:acetyl esterase/lipase
MDGRPIYLPGNNYGLVVIIKKNLKMKKYILMCLLITAGCLVYGQEKVIKLYDGKAPGSENWDWTEKVANTAGHEVYNVVNPTLTVYLADPAVSNGTAVIICPGGGFHMLSIESEGSMVAKWLNAKGVTAFVLKYRLVHSLTDNPVKEMMSKFADPKALDRENGTVVTMAAADGKMAMEYVRKHAAEYHIEPHRIGLMGFSAGGTVAMGVGLTYTNDTRPDFLAAIYAYTKALGDHPIPGDAPPIFICAATDDQLVMSSLSANLYLQWIAAKRPAELHIYAKGGHGFGMNAHGIPVSGWIDRFGDWLKQQGYLKPLNK